MTIFVPADLPIVEPDNWDIFWDIWHSHSRPLVKKYMNPLSKTRLETDDVWIGLDIFKKNIITAYDAPFFDISKFLPKLYFFISTFDSLCFRIRLCQSLCPIGAHTDDNLDNWKLRAYFYYTDSNQQWYFTKPHDAHGHRRYISMPQETNWFLYNDKKVWHGTDYVKAHKKILLQVYSYNRFNDLSERSILKFPSYKLTEFDL